MFHDVSDSQRISLCCFCLVLWGNPRVSLPRLPSSWKKLLLENKKSRCPSCQSFRPRFVRGIDCRPWNIELAEKLSSVPSPDLRFSSDLNLIEQKKLYFVMKGTMPPTFVSIFFSYIYISLSAWISSLNFDKILVHLNHFVYLVIIWKKIFYPLILMISFYFIQTY